MGINADTKPMVGGSLWGVVGAAIVVGVLSLGTPAWIFAGALAVAVVLAGLPVRIDALLVGAALPLLLIALSNATGPGWTCRSGPSEAGCDELLDPRPFLVAALTLLLGGVAIHWIGRRRLRRDHG